MQIIAACLQLFPDPTWLNGNGWLIVVSSLSLVAAAATTWAAYLKWRLQWRLATESAWIDRSGSVARERSRILEIISSNQELEKILTEICAGAVNLLPGTDCSYNLQLANDSLLREVDSRSTDSGIGDDGQRKDALAVANRLHAAAPRKTLFELALCDDSDRIVGKIIVTAASDHIPADDSGHIFDLISELASLSLRNSLLYQRLIYHSTHDPLTQLANRRLYENQLDEALEQAKVQGGRVAVIYIDVNHFKHVNDKFGHKIGDLYLKQISARLRHQLRPMDLLARVGGDEFNVILHSPDSFDRVFTVTGRLKGCFNDPFSLDGKIVNGSASFGFARYPEDGLTAVELTRVADHAMYLCKHDAHVAQEALGLAIISPDELGLALINGDFRVYYQPQFSASGKLTGVEALLRLDHPTLGLLPPSTFISVAERHSVIHDLGAWLLRIALSDAKRWKVSVAVNVSSRQLQDPGYATSVLECLHDAGFPPARLELELVERSLMGSEDTVLQQLQRLRKANVRIALDDFGTEQSCLSLVHKLPIDTIKLDRSFIRAMDDEPQVLPVIRAIVSMARDLGKRVIAEAIEHVGPIPALMEMGEMDFQGYLLSRPLPAAEIDKVIATWRSGIVMPEAFLNMKSRGEAEALLTEPRNPEVNLSMDMAARSSSEGTPPTPWKYSM
jgi:diguanylate cyclase (GGDEF)-like protein